MKLPREYQPKVLLEEKPKLRPRTMYAIGIEREPREFGMINGPNPNLMKMLEEVGERGHRIIRLRRDGYDEVIYRWRKDRWVRYREEDHVEQQTRGRTRPTHPPKSR